MQNDPQTSNQTKQRMTEQVQNLLQHQRITRTESADNQHFSLRASTRNERQIWDCYACPLGKLCTVVLERVALYTRTPPLISPYCRCHGTLMIFDTRITGGQQIESEWQYHCITLSFCHPTLQSLYFYHTSLLLHQCAIVAGVPTYHKLYLIKCKSLPHYNNRAHIMTHP